MRSAARSRSGGGGGGEMAAAGLAAPEGGSAGMPLGTAVAAAVCPPPPAGPGSWSRSLDRALEEAAASGTLSLSGRKLRDYPRASAANHDLSDTTRADLSRNRLSELPAEACHFVSLESLNVYQNCIRYIPEAVLNLQSLTFLNISRNQLSTLPVHLCSLPLKVLIASNNKLVSIPEEIGQLRQLTELDVSCNEIQTIPPQIGNLESLRDLNVRRNHLVRLPEELAELPLIRLDFSCNKITTIPVCYRNLRHLQTIMLENNPLQSPPAQICIKGKIHIFKYLNIEACKIAPDLPDYDRRPMGFGSCHEELYSSRPYGALDSGFNSVDSGDKRWSGNEPTDEFSDLPLRVAEITKEQRLRRESQYQENRGSTVVTNGGVEHDLDQIDYIDSCATEEEEEEVRQPKCMDSDSLSSQFMAYIDQRRISNEGSPVKPVSIREFQKTESRYLHQNRHIERTRREAQLAALQYEEERMRTKQIQREAVLDFVKQKASLSTQKQSPLDSECPFPSRRSQHTDDSALLVVRSFHLSPPYPGHAAPPSYRNPSQRPESFLFRTAVRDEANKGRTLSLPPLQPKLTMAKCRRNVENFLEACRRIGVPQEQLCLPLHILEEKGLTQVAVTVQALLELAPPKQQQLHHLSAV
uniref:Leucine rich repeats and calponin homology domain containing 3 n=1 Tax=Cairina moschata TaxID=8855 RepID=A0A8C3B6M4_CAIMO